MPRFLLLQKHFTAMSENISILPESAKKPVAPIIYALVSNAL